jgi:hypothetical protein
MPFDAGDARSQDSGRWPDVSDLPADLAVLARQLSSQSERLASAYPPGSESIRRFRVAAAPGFWRGKAAALVQFWRRIAAAALCVGLGIWMTLAIQPLDTPGAGDPAKSAVDARDPGDEASPVLHDLSFSSGHAPPIEGAAASFEAPVDGVLPTSSFLRLNRSQQEAVLDLIDDQALEPSSQSF